MTNLNPFGSDYTQDVEREGRYFGNLRELAENNYADPGEEFFIDLTLEPATGYYGAERAVLVRESINTFGVLPAGAVDEWWPLLCALHDVGEDAVVPGRVWTSTDWESDFYASVKLAMPTVEEACEEVDDDGVELTEANFAAWEHFDNFVEEPWDQRWLEAHGRADDAPALNDSDSLTRAAAVREYEGQRKSGGPMWALWLLLGAFGGHRYYLGDTKRGGVMTAVGIITAWVVGEVWALVDAFSLNARLREVNQATWSQIAAKYRLTVDPSPVA